MTEQTRRKAERPGTIADITNGETYGEGKALIPQGGTEAQSTLQITNYELPEGGEVTPHPAAGASTLSPRGGLEQVPSADIAKNATSAPPAGTPAHLPEARPARAVNDVANLPAEMRELVERMMVEGATFEDICDAVNDRNVPLTLQAVQNLYRGSLELQKRRIEFQLERARALTEALGDPESSDAQLAYAAMLTGLQSLNRKDGTISVKDAVKGSMERRNLILKRDLLRKQIEREDLEKRFRRTRLYAEMLRARLTRIKLVQLRRELAKHENSGTLGRVAMEKIQEIYGLLQVPVVPSDADLEREQNIL
ncbi:MAG TPA: hypothetical protein VFQ24_11675 [Terriglobia bacterium]|nr:hypothetical protein [Terriglobia bacterium]